MLDVSLPNVSTVLRALVLTLDLAGTFVFGLSGGLTAVNRRLDFFGILVLSVVAGNAGGIMRDVLIGAVPPAALRDWWYLAVALLAGVVAFFWHGIIERLHGPVQIFDGAGLALFAVVGAEKALIFGLAPVMAIVLGMITGIGGGIARDVLASEVPTVLRTEVYAIAGLAAAAVVALGHVLHVPSAIAMISGALLCFAMRMTAIRRRWNLPKPRINTDTRSEG